MAARLILYIRWLLLFLIAVAIPLVLVRWRFPRRRLGLAGFPRAIRNFFALMLQERLKEREINTSRKALSGRSVLLAVPGDREAKVLRWKLAAHGCTISRVSNGRQAVNAALDGVDVIIADSLLPDMSLTDLVEAIPPGTPLVLLGVTPAQVESIRAGDGRVAFIYSGYDPDDVSTTAGRLLRSLDTNRI